MQSNSDWRVPADGFTRNLREMNDFRPTGSSLDIVEALVIEPRGRCFVPASLFVRTLAQTSERAAHSRSRVNDTRCGISGRTRAPCTSRHQPLRPGPSGALLYVQKRLGGGLVTKGVRVRILAAILVSGSTGSVSVNGFLHQLGLSGRRPAGPAIPARAPLGGRRAA